MMQHLTGFAPLADRFDGFILDLWGVIHDGATAFPSAIDCLSRLRAAGKPTLLLSNVPRPNVDARALMQRMGIADDCYTDILTSGKRSGALCRTHRVDGGQNSAGMSSILGRNGTGAC